MEENIRTFADHWTGTGTIENSGNAERLVLDAGEEMVSEVVETGTLTTRLTLNKYAAADTVTMYYRTGADSAACQAAAWAEYSTPFDSLGFAQVKVAA